MSFLHFNELNSPSTKTKIWEVTNVSNDIVLGLVSFWSAWRKYVFRPGPGTLYDPACLHEIANFAEQQTAAWRNK